MENRYPPTPNYEKLWYDMRNINSLLLACKEKHPELYDAHRELIMDVYLKNWTEGDKLTNFEIMELIGQFRKGHPTMMEL